MQDLHVVATAGHVDHGKSALILRLTGIDPDRLEEEKRRGLTIDLGFAWTTLPSGREVGFVDVPGHERFIRNMLAGVGPVRLALFVVAADEGWKPQSEEHLQILDVLGTEGAVVALTKADLVDVDTLAERRAQVAEQLQGTRLEGARIVTCSARSGSGLEELQEAIDAMLAAARAPERTGRARAFVDRIFTIRGAGTVVTGTLSGGPLSVGDEAELLPSGERARIRGLQTHKRQLDTAWPVSRVAVNLAGTAKDEPERGDVLTLRGRWRVTRTFEGWIRPVRGLTRPLSARGAYKVHIGTAERDARLRILGADRAPADRTFVRITLARPVVLDVTDVFVLRDAGRQETVAGGEVLDAFPPERPGADPVARLRERVGADRGQLALRTVIDRGFVPSADLRWIAGVEPEDVLARGAVAVGGWVAAPASIAEVERALRELIASHHAEHPLGEGPDVGEARAAIAAQRRTFDPDLADALIDHLVAAGAFVRRGNAIRLPGHEVAIGGRAGTERLVAAVEGGEPTPPTVTELVASGFGLEVIRAACADGRLVRVSPDLVLTPAFLDEARTVVRELGAAGPVTVSAYRAALGTSRKYAVPILEHFDARGLTRREGDVRVLRG